MIEVVRVEPKDWRTMSESAHIASFNKHKPAEWDRLDYALLVKNVEDLMGYVTCRELDAHTVYWQFGGAFPGTLKNILVLKGYRACISYAKEKYQRITTLIENSNTPMLKLAMSEGFRIVGIRNFKGSILLEHVLEF